MTFRRSFLYLSQPLLLYLLFTASFCPHASLSTAQQLSNPALSSNPVSEYDDTLADHRLKTSAPSSVPSLVPNAEHASNDDALGKKSPQHLTEQHSKQLSKDILKERNSITTDQDKVSPSADAKEDDYAYIAFYKGEDFGTDQNAISVHINGVPASGILLYNSTMLSFRIPSDFLTDHKLFVSAFVEIRLASQRLAHLPLNVLKDAISRVSLTQYRLSASEISKRRSSLSNSYSSIPDHQSPRSLKDETDESVSTNHREVSTNELKLVNSGGESRVESPHVTNDVPVSSDVRRSDLRNDAKSHTDGSSNGVEFMGKDDNREAVNNDESLKTELKKEKNQQNSANDDVYDDDGISAKAASATNKVKPDDMDSPADMDMNVEHDKRVEVLIRQANELLLSNRIQSNRKAVVLLEQAHEAGNVTASTVLGSIYLAAPAGVPRDLEKASFYLQKASGAGFPDAQALLGFLYASGFAAPHVPVHIGAALLLWTFAAEGGSVIARMALAYRYFTGTDVPEDCPRSSALYKSVADEVYENIMKENAAHKRPRTPGWDEDASTYEIIPPKGYNLPRAERRHLTEEGVRRIVGENHEIVQYYQHSADRGDPSSQLIMGQLYYYGAEGLPQNPERARRLFKQAAEVGRAEAHAHLGYMDLREGKNESAVKHLNEAATHDERLGLHGMGYVLLRGIGGKKDPKQAVKYFHRAAEKKHPEAMFNLGVLYAKGVGVPAQSPVDSFKYFTGASGYGHLQSNYKVGTMMLKGLVPATEDCRGGTGHLKFVAEQGMWTNVLSRALRAYERNQYSDALYRYLLAAHVGIEVGQYNAAFMYEHGTVENVDGYPKKFFERGKEVWKGRLIESERDERKILVEKALELYQMSASQNEPEAMVRLGDLAFGEAKDYKRAALAYEQAVRLRNAEAIFNLGMMHARGYGMNADKHMAKRYFDQAMESDADAKIPATIALFLLQYSDHLGELWSKVIDHVEKVKDSLFYFVRFDNEMPAGSEKEIAVAEKQTKRKSTNDKEILPENGTFISFRSLLDLIYTMDVFAISVLLGLLVIVVNARQRRILEVNRNIMDEDQNEPDGHEPAEHQREAREGAPRDVDGVQPLDGQA